MVKMKNKNNKGNALYYVMIMLIIVTLILSATLYASYRNALITHNYSSGEEDYFKCDSALEALRGQLAARLVGEKYPGITGMIGNDATADIFIFKSAAKNNSTVYYLSIGIDDSTYFSINQCVDDFFGEGDSVAIKVNEYEGGYIAVQEDIKDSNGVWIDTCIRIKGVTVEYETVMITTDIVININTAEISNLNDDVFESVVFQNYTVETVAQPQEGGGE